MSKAGGDHIDRGNKRAVLNAIRERWPLSRKDAASGSGLSLSTAKRLIEELLTEKVVEEIPAEGRPKVRGPKAGSLRLRGGYGYGLGLNIEPERIELCAASLSGEILSLESHPLRERGSEGTIRQSPLVCQ